MKSRPISAGQTILATQNNDRRDDARGGGFLLAHQMLGTLALGTAPTNGQLIPIVINGTTVTLKAVASVASANDIFNPGTALGFATNVLNFLRRPDLTNSNQVAASGANQTLLSYVGWAWPGSSTSIVAFSLNKDVNGVSGLLTSFNITGMTVTGATWTSNTMALYVQDGTYYVDGTRYLFTGGSTPTVTAPVSHPRIDVLTIDTSGTLAWTAGTENASPVAPAYPSNKMAICELYNVVGETALYDTEDQQSGQGYVLNDVRPTTSYGPILTAIASDLAPDATDARNIGESSGNEWNNIFAKGIFASSVMQLNGANVAFSKFGGTGTDGALSITSGTTTLSFASAQVLVKDYSSISITGTAALTFSNPNSAGSCALIRSSGNVTITSSAAAAIYVDGMGAPGGAGAVSSLTASSPGGNATLGWYKSNGATTGSYGPGTPGASTNGAMAMYTQSKYLSKHYPFVFAGGGGCGGVYDGSVTSVGAGGAGGGALVIECAGSLDFTGTITANGLAGAATVNGSIQAAGGGGGAAGSIVILYNFQTAISGTLTANGGANTLGTGPGTNTSTSGGGTPFASGGTGSGNFGANGQTLITTNTEFS